MDLIQKRTIQTLINESLQNMNKKKIAINNFVVFEDKLLLGCKINAVYKGVDVPIFIGTINTPKYENSLIAAILSEDITEEIKKVKLENIDGVQIIDSTKIKENLWKKDRKEQLKFFQDFIYSYILIYKLMYCAAGGKKTVAIDNERVGLLQWIVLIELPWVVFFSSICYAVYKISIEVEAGNFILNSHHYLCFALICISLLSILFTIKLKNKVRNYENKKITLNPKSWFISYIAKIVIIGLGTFLLSGVLIFIYIIKGIFTSDEGSIRSRNKQSSINSFSSPKIFWYCCGKCGTIVKQSRKPEVNGCKNHEWHNWYELGEVGTINYQCRHCNVVVQTTKQPRNCSTNCYIGGWHEWIRL
ncbi:hypothetical protein [Treponema sp. C6A8]|uniref:hypothetical protein n=1 Tax=Treponema sp. C6A8 TaxID=1410609 RepID=UPI0004842AF6|nr:hypothetical protein [Treponema sp. C6A8]